MKDLAADESLSEEARESAKKALDVLVSSQLLDIEQTAALKKLESEAKFVNQQAQIEQCAALEKQQAAAVAEAQSKRQTVEAKKVLQAVEIDEMEAEAESKRKMADAKKMLQAAQVLSDDMMEWLGQHRLQQCAADLARIAGAYVLTSS